MSTGARGRGRGRGRGQKRGRGRGGANAATQKIITPQEETITTTTVEDNNDDNLLTTDDAPQQKQQKQNDVTMTEKEEENNTPPTVDAPASAPTNNTNNNKKKQKRKRGRKEAENGDVPAVAETNEGDEPKNEDNDNPVEPPAKRQKTENGDNRPRRQQRERQPRELWGAQNELLKGKTLLIALYNIDPETTVKQLEKLVEEKVGIRPKQLRIVHRVHRQHTKASPQPQPGKAIITFATPEDATTGVEKLTGLKLKDRELKVQYTREIKPELSENLRGISQVLKLYELYDTTNQDVIDAIHAHCTDVPENLEVTRIYAHGYDYGVVKVNAGSASAAQRIEKELKGKLIKNKTPLIGYWVPNHLKRKIKKEQEQMQVDNE